MRTQQSNHNEQSEKQMTEQKTAQKPQYISAFRALSGYVRPHLWAFAGVLICTVIAILSDLFQPYLMKIAIDDNLMVGNNDYRALLIICGVYLVLSLFSFLFTYLQSNLLQYIGQSIVERIRKQLFHHISKLSMSYFDRVSSGSLITHVSSDTEALNQFFNQVLLSLFRDGLMLIFIIVMMFQLDKTLALYCLILLPIISFIAIAFRTYMRKTYQLTRTRLSRMVAFVAENLAGMNLVQVFHQQKEQEKQFKERNNSYFKANVREISLNVVFGRTFEILSILSISFVTWVGGNAVLGTNLEFGVLYAFITYIRLFFQPINTITQQWNTLQSATVAVSRIWGIFAIQPEVTDSVRGSEQDQAAASVSENGKGQNAAASVRESEKGQGAVASVRESENEQAVAASVRASEKGQGATSSVRGSRGGEEVLSLEQVKGRIDFDHISFSYEEGVPIIRNLELHIKQGELIGVVGTTGAGKSSLISLLCRFYDVKEGSVRIDGVDVRDIPQATLHRIVGLVQQEPYLYSGSIVDNVRMFDESITREEVIQACTFVGADAIIQRMKEGYDTLLSERGSGLSAGERQLISFARIIVFKPRILILDEASANLDSQTEQLIQDALHVASKGRTTIVIAHRLSTIMQADRIIVMKHGEIVEQGNHHQLLEQKGHYEELYSHSMGKLAVGAK